MKGFFKKMRENYCSGLADNGLEFVYDSSKDKAIQ